MSTTPPGAPVSGGPAKLIACILPDDGAERRLLRWLRDEKGITRANSTYCRGLSVLGEPTARPGKLPDPSLVRLVTIVVEPDEADAIFDLVCEQANIHRPGGGSVLMMSLAFATPFVLPDGVPNETGGVIGEH